MGHEPDPHAIPPAATVRPLDDRVDEPPPAEAPLATAGYWDNFLDDEFLSESTLPPRAEAEAHDADVYDAFPTEASLEPNSDSTASTGLLAIQAGTVSPTAVREHRRTPRRPTPLLMDRRRVRWAVAAATILATAAAVGALATRIITVPDPGQDHRVAARASSAGAVRPAAPLVGESPQRAAPESTAAALERVELKTQTSVPLPLRPAPSAKRAVAPKLTAPAAKRAVAPKPPPAVPIARRVDAPATAIAVDAPRLPQTVSLEETPTVPAPAPPVSTALAPPSTAASTRGEVRPPAGTVIGPAGAIGRVLGQYQAAFEQRDVEAVRRVWPTVDHKALGKAFDQLEEENLRFDSCTVSPSGAKATVSCNGTIEYVPKVGSKRTRVEHQQWRFSLREASSGWLVESVEVRQR